jgi:hypothetical protein
VNGPSAPTSGGGKAAPKRKASKKHKSKRKHKAKHKHRSSRKHRSSKRRTTRKHGSRQRLDVGRRSPSSRRLDIATVRRPIVMGRGR